MPGGSGRKSSRRSIFDVLTPHFVVKRRRMMISPLWSRYTPRSLPSKRLVPSIWACLIGCCLVGLTLPVSAQSSYGSNTYSERTSDDGYHVVQEGETLYDLSAEYFGDRQRWPKLWSYNPQITNPHWIYPGDVVYLQPPEQTETPDDTNDGTQQTSSEQQGDEDSMEINTVDEVKKGLLFDVAGIIVKDQPEFVGRIVGSPKEARLLGEYDQVWVGFGDRAYAGKQRNRIPPRRQADIRDPGEIERKMRFAIVQEDGPVEDLDGNEVGTKYYVIGSLVITETSDDSLSTGYIDRSWREIERGDKLIPYERQLKRVTQVPARKNVVTNIIDTLTETFNFGESQYVFLDQGAADGLRVGNRGYIYQRRSGLPKRWRQRPDIPWVRVGRVRLIEVREHFSTAIVTQSERELGIGDRVEMYKGN